MDDNTLIVMERKTNLSVIVVMAAFLLFHEASCFLSESFTDIYIWSNHARPFIRRFRRSFSDSNWPDRLAFLSSTGNELAPSKKAGKIGVEEATAFGGKTLDVAQKPMLIMAE